MSPREKRGPKDRDAGSECAEGDDPSGPMDRFKSLTEKIIKVPRSAINEQERLYNEAKAARKAAKSGNT